MVSRMYPAVSWITDEYLVDPRETRPLVLCEYAHYMGNGAGSLKEYLEAFRSSDRVMGGLYGSLPITDLKSTKKACATAAITAKLCTTACSVSTEFLPAIAESPKSRVNSKPLTRPYV
ncbi:MAG: glycoside hydrolase family 2 TIM barrel-domain containing protein [Christensenellales bacterium]